MMKDKLIALLFAAMLAISAKAQVGEHRNEFSVGVTGGCVLSNVGFTPTVNQSLHNGVIGGFMARYKSEKYFSTICSIQMEVNYAQTGWKEEILDANDKPVVNKVTNMPEEYSRTLNYIQVPLLAHLAWGREYKGLQFFVNLGPQFGYMLGESTSSNFDFATRNMDDRTNPVVAQDTMAVEHKFDYGIAAGAGLEFSLPKLGHFQVEARYYYGLANIYGSTKRDYFAKSNRGDIVIKASYLFDITRTKKISRKK